MVSKFAFAGPLLLRSFWVSQSNVFAGVHFCLFHLKISRKMGTGAKKKLPVPVRSSEVGIFTSIFS